MAQLQRTQRNNVTLPEPSIQRRHCIVSTYKSSFEMELHLSITSPLRIPHHSHLSSELFFRINMEPTRILTSEFGSAILFWICVISSLLVCQAAIAVRRFHKVYRTSELFCVVTVYFFLYHYISLWAFQIDVSATFSVTVELLLTDRDI